MECLQANLRWLLRENKQADNQLHLFVLDTSETPKTAGIMNQEFPKESFTGKIILHLPQILPNKAFLEISKTYLEKMMSLLPYLILWRLVITNWKLSCLIFNNFQVSNSRLISLDILRKI